MSRRAGRKSHKCLSTIYGPDGEIIYQGYDPRKANRIWGEMLKPSLERWGKAGGRKRFVGIGARG